MADVDALADLRAPWCLRVAVTLRIAERIEAGTTSVADLALEAGCDARALHDVLGHLASVGVFDDDGTGHFTLNGAARELLDPGVWLMLDLDGIGGRFAGAWATLPAYVKTGRTAYHEAFGQPFWEDLAAHPQIGATFDALMGPAGHGSPDPDIPISGGWGSVASLVDVGGGTGIQLAAVLQAHPHLRGTLVDLPATVARAAEVFAAAGVADRVTIRAQSFFDPLPAGSDVYLLKSVLNDWPERESLAILTRCAEAALPGGRVLVCGGVAADDRPGGLNLETVLVGGTTSALSEFRALARDAGLEVTAVTAWGSRLVVECAAPRGAG